MGHTYTIVTDMQQRVNGNLFVKFLHQYNGNFFSIPFLLKILNSFLYILKILILILNWKLEFLNRVWECKPAKQIISFTKWCNDFIFWNKFHYYKYFNYCIILLNVQNMLKESNNCGMWVHGHYLKKKTKSSIFI